MLSHFTIGILAFGGMGKALQLPIEVVGADGTEVAVRIDMPAGASGEVRGLWMQIHGLEYDDLASVRVNNASWVNLNNKSVAVAEPGKSYGGIGGGFGTLKLTLELPPGLVVDQANTIRFRFNRTNGVVSGYRVLALNFVTADGRKLLPEGAFSQDDPNQWKPPLPAPLDIATGKSLWEQGKLAANGLAGAPPVRAHCADCHARDGRDLKYFNYSNASIVARSRFHGLSEHEGEQIASYIRSLDFPNPGRPWNPPYQPGLGIDEQPQTSWAAGAGLSAVLDHDADTLKSLAGGKIEPSVFNPDGNLNQREIPIAMQLPDWNHWLPHTHPVDIWGDRFDGSALAQMYTEACGSKAEDVAKFFDEWGKARAKFLTPHLAANSKKWTRPLAEEFYAAQLWQLVKTWELTQQYGWEAQGSQTRVWPNTMAEQTAPTALNIPDTSAGMGGSGLTNEYFSSAWYQLQITVNSGSHKHHGRAPLDWPYLVGHFRDLEQLSGEPEPGRLLVTVIKALQSTDSNIGPENVDEGWRPERTIDPRIMVAPEWSKTFSALDAQTRLAITQSLLAAWLDKNLHYPAGAYFQLGRSASGYLPPADLQGISGGRAWEEAGAFTAAGVDQRLVAQLQNWGKTYTSLAGLFHY